MRFNLVVLIAVFLLSGCLPTRKVNNTKESFKFTDTSTVTTTSPRDFIILPSPKTPKDRPKDTTQTFAGEKGAKATLRFDKDGFFDGGHIDCPEINILEQKDLELDYDRKEKESERVFNLEMAKEIKSTIIWVSLIFAVAMIIKSKFS